MASPVPYPIGGGEELLSFTFPNDLVADGWTWTADPAVSDQGVGGWWQGVAPDGSIDGPPTGAFIAGAVLFGWLDGNPFNRWSWWTKTFTGFTPNQRLRFIVNATWQLGTGIGGGGSRVGMMANGVFGTLPFPWWGGPARNFEIETEADGSGEVEVKIGVENIHPSMNVNFRWNNFTVESIGFDADPFSDIIADSAVLYLNGVEADVDTMTLTRGGASFDPQDEYESYPFPGKAAGHVLGLHQLKSSMPVVRANALLTGERQIEIYSPSGEWGDHATITGARTYTPGQFRAALDAGVYISNFVCVWKRLRNDYIAVEFPKALVLKWTGIDARDADEGTLPIEVYAVQDRSLETWDAKTTRLYYIHTYPTGFLVGA